MPPIKMYRHFHYRAMPQLSHFQAIFRKKKNCCQNKIADLKKKRSSNKNYKGPFCRCWGAPDCPRDPQTRGTPWDFSHLVSYTASPPLHVAITHKNQSTIFKNHHQREFVLNIFKIIFTPIKWQFKYKI
jgi:hypothetical protein